jgi:hypothetical protein
MRARDAQLTATLRDVKLTSLLVGCVLAISAAPLAHADEEDNAYQAGVQSVGVPVGSPAAGAPYGRQLCDRLPQAGFDPLVHTVSQENAGLTLHLSALVIGAAVSNFCLDKSSQLPATLNY